MAKTKTPLKVKLRIPCVIVDVREADPQLVDSLLPGLEELPARIRILGGKSKRFPQVFSVEEALEEGQIWVLPSKHLFKQFSLVVDHGLVPVMLEGLHKAAENYNPVEEHGNAFLFEKLGAWNVYRALVRAIENFAFSYDWENLKSQGKVMIKL